MFQCNCTICNNDTITISIKDIMMTLDMIRDGRHMVDVDRRLLLLLLLVVLEPPFLVPIAVNNLDDVICFEFNDSCCGSVSATDLACMEEDNILGGLRTNVV